MQPEYSGMPKTAYIADWEFAFLGFEMLGISQKCPECEIQDTIVYGLVGKEKPSKDANAEGEEEEFDGWGWTGEIYRETLYILEHFLFFFLQNFLGFWMSFPSKSLTLAQYLAQMLKV